MSSKKITIGRDPHSDIVVDERWDTVSNEHADIELRDGDLMFYDHSSNGTVINKQKIHNTNVGIYPGDVIMLAGKFELKWDAINQYFPQSQRPTVIRNVRAENSSVGRKTIQQGDSNPQDTKSSRATEQFTPRQHSFIQQGATVVGEKSDNFGVENTYSQAEIDKEIEKWNWGAFFCSWIWAAFHKIYWPLFILIVGCIPYLGQVALLALSVYLGFTGSTKAWNSGRYTNFESYKSAQKRWAVIGVFLFAIGIVTEAFLIYHLLTLI